MIALLTLILVIILVSRLFESVLKIPFTLGLILTAYTSSHLFPDALSEISDNFDEIIYMMLPVILLPDVLQLPIKRIRQNLGVLLYLAVIGVLISVALSSLMSVFWLAEYQWTVGILIALYAMLMATDAITVNSVFQHFNIPERLKIYAEGESLLNDITALILFYFVAMPLISTADLHLLGVNLVIVKVLVFSILVGSIVSFAGYIVLKVLHESFDQIILIYLVTILSFIVAEHLELSGILSIVASIMTLKYFVDRENSQINQKLSDKHSFGLFDYRALLARINRIPAISDREFWAYKKEAYYIGVFANSVVFIAIANLVKIDQLQAYFTEILIVFVITTLARAMTVQGLAIRKDIPSRWRTVLTISGMKGGLAIIMAHSLPESFIYRDMFEAIVVGIVLLSTFVYTTALVVYLWINRTYFNADRLQAEEPELKDFALAVQGVVQRDGETGAFNPVVFEEKLHAEISRAIRYKTDLSIVMIELEWASAKSSKEMAMLGDSIRDLLRDTDIFGRFTEKRLVILCTNTPLEGVLVLVERLKNRIKALETNDLSAFSLGYAELSEGDTSELFIEHVESRLEPV